MTERYTAFHLARTIFRRVERRLVALARAEPAGEWTIPYLNRLSGALFVLARAAKLESGVADVLWDSRA